MADFREVWHETTGARYLQYKNGEIVYAPKAGVMAQAGRQFDAMRTGIQAAYGDITGNEELSTRARQESAERAERMRPTDLADPGTALVGRSLPGLATGMGVSYLGARAGLGAMGQWALGSGYGAAETAVDLERGGSWAGRAGEGFVASQVGEVAGRMAGRVLNGLGGFIRASAGEGIPTQALSQAAREAQEQGFRTTASQNLADAPGGQFARQLQTGAEATMVPPKAPVEVRASNQQLLNERAAASMGVKPPANGKLDDAFFNDVQDHFKEQFRHIQRHTAGPASIELDAELAQFLRKNKDMQAINEQWGYFEGLGLKNGKKVDLEKGQELYITQNEWMEARETFADWISAESAKRPRNAQRAQELLERMDEAIEQSIGDGEFGEAYGRLREQYRNLIMLEKPSVMKDGDVQPNVLNRVLRSKNGYGRQATAGQPVRNDETRTLIDSARVLSHKDLLPYQTSKTAENQAMREGLRDATEGGQALAEGDAIGFLAAAARFGGGLLSRPLEAGGGQIYRGLATANPAVSYIGQQGGRAVLDEVLYPYVGSEDDRPR